MPSHLEQGRSLRGLLTADEWLLAFLVWLVPLIGIFAVVDATFVRFGLPAAVSTSQWLAFHAVFLLPGMVFLVGRVWVLCRFHARSTLVEGSVATTTKARLGSGWYVTVTYTFSGQSFTKRFYVQSASHFRRLAGSATTSLLVDPVHPSRSYLANTLLEPFFA